MSQILPRSPRPYFLTALHLLIKVSGARRQDFSQLPLRTAAGCRARARLDMASAVSPWSAHREWGRRDATGVLIGVCLQEQGMREGGNEQERTDEGQR